MNQQQAPSILPPAEDIGVELSRLNDTANQAMFNGVFPAQIVNDPNDPAFEVAKITELKIFLDKGTYKIVSEEDVLPNGTILNSRFLLSIKSPDSLNPIYEARFIIQGHKDPEKGKVVNEAHTVLRSSVRLIIALSQAYGFPLWSRDVSQAFVQSEDNLKRNLYIRVPKGQRVLEILGAPPGSLLQALKPLYGLAESPSYW